MCPAAACANVKRNMPVTYFAVQRRTQRGIKAENLTPSQQTGDFTYAAQLATTCRKRVDGFLLTA